MAVKVFVTEKNRGLGVFQLLQRSMPKVRFEEITALTEASVEGADRVVLYGSLKTLQGLIRQSEGFLHRQRVVIITTSDIPRDLRLPTWATAVPALPTNSAIGLQLARVLV